MSENIVRLPRKLTAADRVAQKIERAFKKNLRGAMMRARERDRDFSIDLDWALDIARNQGFRCAVTRIPFYACEGDAFPRHPFAPSFDRIDTTIGYTRENVRIVILALNVMFADWGPDIFELVSNAYRKHKMETLFPAGPARVRANSR